jgi:hypothetical protein
MGVICRGRSQISRGGTDNWRDCANLTPTPPIKSHMGLTALLGGQEFFHQLIRQLVIALLFSGGVDKAEAVGD